MARFLHKGMCDSRRNCFLFNVRDWRMLETTLQATRDSYSTDKACMTLERAFRDCEARLGRPATNLDICDELGLNLKELYALLDRYRGIGLGCVDDCAPVAEATDVGPRVKYLPDPAQKEFFCIYLRSAFRVAMVQAVDALPKNEKLVVSLYHNEDLTMQEIAQIFGISEIRVAQIHTTAMLRIRGKLLGLEEI
jgi:RNA polymerase sigma factor FliA